MSLPLPGFATQEFALTQSHLVVTQLYPSSPGSRSSTTCYDLADVDSENSRTAMSSSPVSDLVVPSVYRGCGPWGCGVTGVRRCCHVLGYVDYYKLILATQTPGVTDIYEDCRLGGDRVAGARWPACGRFGYLPCYEPVCATQPS